MQPTKDQAHRTAARIISTSRAMVLQPDDMAARTAFVRATFNHDLTAAGIVLLADSRLLLLAVVKRAELFLAGFEDDPAQAGVADLLRDLRAAHGDAEAAA